MGKMWDGPFRLWQVRCILTEPERFFAYILIIIYSDGLAHFGPERYQFCAPEDVHNSISQKRWDGPVWFLGTRISTHECDKHSTDPHWRQSTPKHRLQHRGFSPVTLSKRQRLYGHHQLNIKQNHRSRFQAYLPSSG